ncbi:MAG: prolyl oligopeptidase family serine peptidase [Acidobacteriales bacterium]|nr:prolyl oligopeptidase family serine peptidase [Terriglobales bacterium]
MRKIRLNVLLLCVIVSSATAFASTTTNGQILSSSPWPALPDWESLDDFTHNYFPRAVYEEARAQRKFDVLDIMYSSAGISVKGMLIRPKDPANRKWPAIIFNRGGTGDYGRIGNYGVPCKQEHDPCVYLVNFYLLAKSGFVVIASDYRFHGTTGKRDEWGGVDVDDVLNLVPALKSLSFVDPERLYMLGQSRGGTMTYIALKRGAPVKAAAVIAGPSDLRNPRPDFLNGDQRYDGFAKVWPDYEHRAGEHYHTRSAVDWPELINVPLLILHSRTDRLVQVRNSLRMAEALQQKNKVYSLVIYDGDGHSLPLNREDRNRKIVEWFNRFGAKAVALDQTGSSP